MVVTFAWLARRPASARVAARILRASSPANTNRLMRVEGGALAFGGGFANHRVSPELCFATEHNSQSA